MMKFRYSLLVLTSSPLLAGETPLTFVSPDSSKAVLEEEPILQSESRWQLRSGAMWRRLGKLTLDPQLQNGSFAGNFLDPPTGPGTAGVNGNRTYDNGFVNLGSGTATNGFTTNWGYQDTGQISGDNLIFTATGGAALDFPTAGSDGDDTAIAPYLELAYLYPIRPNLEIGFTFNFSFTGLDSSINNPLTQSSVTTIDTYALNGVIPPLAPYNGSFGGPGPLIGNQPTNRDSVLAPVGTRNYLFENDTDLYSLALGGEVLWHPTGGSYLSLGAGVVFNFVDWDAQASFPTIIPGTATFTTSRETNGDNEFLLGFYLKAAAGYQFNEHWGLEGFFRYDWNEELTGSVGPSTFEVDLTGLSLGGALTYRF